jgi:hypothetical protein
VQAAHLILWLQIDSFRRHAIRASQIAALSQADAQIVVLPAELVCEHWCGCGRSVVDLFVLAERGLKNEQMDWTKSAKTEKIQVNQ